MTARRRIETRRRSRGSPLGPWSSQRGSRRRKKRTGRAVAFGTAGFRILYRGGFRTIVASAVMMAPVNEMYAGEDQSWQDVYASYGCSLDFDVSDDDG